MNIALRYLKLSSASKPVAAMTIISIIGIAIGVATLTVTIGVANGFDEAYRKSILDFNAHVILLSADAGEIEDYEEVMDNLKGFEGSARVVRADPFIYREGLLVFNGQVRGVIVKGTTNIPGATSPAASTETGSKGSAGRVHLGKYLAEELGAKAGDKIRLMLPGSLRGAAAGHFEELAVAGVFDTGMYDFDSQFLMMDLPVAQDMFDVRDKASGIEIRLDDWQKSAAFAKELEGKFPYPLYAVDWKEMNKSIFEAVKLERLMFIIIMGALVVVASFNIIGTVMLRMLYKTSDISILRALGMCVKNVKKIFIWQGVATGFFGTLSGLTLALILIWLVRKFEWIKIPPEIYLVKTLPVCISLPACVMIAAFSLIVCYLTSAIASRKIVELPVLKGLHRP